MAARAKFRDSSSNASRWEGASSFSASAEDGGAAFAEGGGVAAGSAAAAGSAGFEALAARGFLTALAAALGSWAGSIAAVGLALRVARGLAPSASAVVGAVSVKGPGSPSVRAGITFFAIEYPPFRESILPERGARSFVSDIHRIKTGVFEMTSFDRFMTAPHFERPCGGLSTSLLRSLACAAAVLALTACATPRKPAALAARPAIDPAVTAEVSAAERAPGPYPRIAHTPAMPTDIRPAAAWRQAVLSEWALKRRTEREAQAIPFTLHDSETWAADARARVSPDQAHGAPADADDQAESFAAAERARATPPPSPK